MQRRKKVAIVVAIILAIAAGFIPQFVHKEHRVRYERSEPIVGIGAILSQDGQTKELKINGVLSNSPAALTGLSAGLIILKINGEDISGKSMKECVDLIRGPVGSKVRLQVADRVRGETNDYEFLRQTLQLNPRPADQTKVP